jgi:hypothetical protein
MTSRKRRQRTKQPDKVRRGFSFLLWFGLTFEIEGGCAGSSQVHQSIPSAPFCELCLSHSVLRTGMIWIVDVHEKTTTIKVRILCTPRLNPWATQLAATVSAAPLVVKFSA